MYVLSVSLKILKMQTRFQSRLMPIVPKMQNILLCEPIAMRTRSKMRLYPVIDFDEASRAWNLNKRRVGQGCYEYIPIETKILESISSCKLCQCSGHTIKKGCHLYFFLVFVGFCVFDFVYLVVYTQINPYISYMLSYAGWVLND